MVLFDLLKPASNPNDFDEDGKNFYFDQKNCTRKIAISDTIDEEVDARNINASKMKVKVQEKMNTLIKR